MKFNSQKIINQALKDGFDEFKLTTSSSDTTSIKWENNKIESLETSKLDGVSLFGVIDGIEDSISMSGFTDEKIIGKLPVLKENIKYKSRETNISYISPEGLEYAKAPKSDFKPIAIETAKDLITRLGKKINASDARIIKENTITIYECRTSEESLVNSKGIDLAKKSGNVFVVVAIIYVKAGAESAEIYVHKAYKHIDDFCEDEFIKLLKEKIDLNLEKQDFENNNYEIVFARGVFYEFFSNFFGHFNARVIIDKLSIWDKSLNTEVASKLITLVDNPIAEAIGEYITFDADGMPTKKLEIIKEGVLKAFIHNLKTAEIMKVKTTGHSVGENPSLINPYIQNGTSSKDEIIASTKDGIYLTGLRGYHSGVNGTSGDFSLEIEGNIIKDGKILKAVKTGVVSGNFFKDVLTQVFAVASDNDFTLGIASPTIKLSKKLSVTR